MHQWLQKMGKTCDIKASRNLRYMTKRSSSPQRDANDPENFWFTDSLPSGFKTERLTRTKISKNSNFLASIPDHIQKKLRDSSKFSNTLSNFLLRKKKSKNSQKRRMKSNMSSHLPFKSRVNGDKMHATISLPKLVRQPSPKNQNPFIHFTKKSTSPH